MICYGKSLTEKKVTKNHMHLNTLFCKNATKKTHKKSIKKLLQFLRRLFKPKTRHGKRMCEEKLEKVGLKE